AGYASDVGEPEGRGRPQIPPQAQHVVDGVTTRRRLILIVDGAEIRDPRSPDLARELRTEHRLHDAPRIDELVGSVELLETLEKDRPLFRIEEREPLVQGHMADIGAAL